MNEWTHFFIKIYLSHFFLERVDIGCVLDVSWRRGQTATYWPKVLLTIAALLSHLGWVAQPWVTGGRKPSVCNWLSRWHLVQNWLQLQLKLTQAVCGTWLYNCLTTTCFCCSFGYLHRCISWLTASVENQYITRKPVFYLSLPPTRHDLTEGQKPEGRLKWG